MYLDCVKCVMSKTDFDTLECDEDSLVECAKDYKTNAVRSMFGLLA